MNWMDPHYLGGAGQPGITNANMTDNAEVIQSALAAKSVLLAAHVLLDR